MAVEINHDEKEVAEKATRKKTTPNVAPVETDETDFTVVGDTQVVAKEKKVVEPEHYDFLLPEGINMIHVNRQIPPIWVGKSGKIRVPKGNKVLLEFLNSIQGCRRLN